MVGEEIRGEVTPGNGQDAAQIVSRLEQRFLEVRLVAGVGGLELSLYRLQILRAGRAIRRSDPEVLVDQSLLNQDLLEHFHHGVEDSTGQGE